MSGGTGQRVPEGARLGDLKPPAVKAVGGGAFSLLAVHGEGIGEGLEEEMARALVGMCGEGARGGLYDVEGALASINAAAEDEHH
jgi:hypothetical protein